MGKFFKRKKKKNHSVVGLGREGAGGADHYQIVVCTCISVMPVKRMDFGRMAVAWGYLQPPSLGEAFAATAGSLLGRRGRLAGVRGRIWI